MIFMLHTYIYTHIVQCTHCRLWYSGVVYFSNPCHYVTKNDTVVLKIIIIYWQLLTAIVDYINYNYKYLEKVQLQIQIKY